MINTIQLLYKVKQASAKEQNPSQLETGLKLQPQPNRLITKLKNASHSLQIYH